ncbi:MAG: GPW/gp25 family protein [Candidatus Methanoperedens sp.]|nr:GPW/gp25 family protein [Candidatus Methanoperedens sp.]MCZ7369700.1 GPW/gp25 family protein [Candidatus Methanoperedens sp.]
MAEPDFLGRGWKYQPDKPVSVRDGKIAYSEGEDSIKESIMIILGTSKGERIMRPDFGCDLNRLVFALNNTTTATLIESYIRESLLKWEPRIEVTDMDIAADEEEGNKLLVNIEYIIKTSNTKDNLVYPFYLERGGI